MLGFIRGDVGDSCEDVRAMRGGTFDTVSVVDTALSRFVVDVEVLEVVIEVNAASTEIASKQGCMSSENGSHVDMSFAN